MRDDFHRGDEDHVDVRGPMIACLVVLVIILAATAWAYNWAP